VSLSTTYQRAAEIRRRHVADAAEHHRGSDADVADFSRKNLASEYVDTAERDADESFTEHRERHRRHVVSYVCACIILDTYKLASTCIAINCTYW